MSRKIGLKRLSRMYNTETKRKYEKQVKRHGGQSEKV